MNEFNEFAGELRLIVKTIFPAIHADFYDKYHSEYREGLNGADFVQFLGESGVDVEGFINQLIDLDKYLDAPDFD